MKKHALLISVNPPVSSGLTDPVQVPSDNVDRLAQLLAARRVGGFERVELVRNPNRQALIDALEAACIALQRRDLIFVYIAGFCVADDSGRACLTTADARDEAVLTDTLPLTMLALTMNLSASQQQVLLLDCARRRPGQAADEGFPALPTADLGAPFRSVVTACKPDLMVDGEQDEPTRDDSVTLAGLLINLLENGDPSGSGRSLCLGRLYELLIDGNTDREPSQAMQSLSVYPGNPSLQDLPIARNQAYVSASRVHARRSSWGNKSNQFNKPNIPNKTTVKVDRRWADRLQPRVRWFRYGLGLGVTLLMFLVLFAVHGWSVRTIQVMIWNESQTIANWAVAVVQPYPASRSFHDLLLMGVPGPTMIALSQGTFLMGSPDTEAERFPSEGPQREVYVLQFAISAGEISFDDYDRFVVATGRILPTDQGWGRGERPVINVSWQDAVDYTRWLSDQTGQRYRLPSEAEWEYLARAGSTTAFSTGNCIDTYQANYNGTFDYDRCGAHTGLQRKQTLTMYALPPNPWGIYHVHGNVWEWVEDCWHVNYTHARTDSAAWTEGGDGQCERRVIRGGGWRFEPGYLRSAARLWSKIDEANQDIGFRVVREP